MKNLAAMGIAFALIASACSGGPGAAVASLDDQQSEQTPAETAESDTEVSQEDALLAFAQCMRDEGVEDFQDPTINADGSIDFRFGPGEGQSELSEEDREAVRSARTACRDSLEGLAFGPGGDDRSEIEDQLYEFAACMRDNGYDMPDPDFTGEPGQGGGPFGSLDRDDPDFVTALDACEDVFGGTFRPGGPGGGRG